MPTNAGLFRRHPNSYFVETGSYLGDGIQAALDAGFSHIISIELSDHYLEISSRRFAGDDRVQVVKGDSGVVMRHVIREICGPITFWLDGHHSCGDTALGEKWSPLIDELHAIAEHPIRTHTILVDDMRCWHRENPVLGFGDEEIREAIREINPDYEISYEDGQSGDEVLQNDILVAVVPQESPTPPATSPAPPPPAER